MSHETEGQPTESLRDIARRLFGAHPPASELPPDPDPQTSRTFIRNLFRDPEGD